MSKAKDHTKTCWSCGGGPIMTIADYYQCRSCGATWNETPKMGPAVMRLEEKTGDDISHFHSVPIPERRIHRGGKNAGRSNDSL
jgi:hypothetical protein